MSNKFDDFQTVTISSSPPTGGIWTYGIASSLGSDTDVLGFTILGSFVGTVTIQCSNDEMSTWVDVPGGTFTENWKDAIFDPLDSAIYRIGIKENEYTSGTCVLEMRGK